MKDFKKQNRFSSGPRTGGFSRGGSSRPSFGGGRPSFGAPKEMHQATCNKCNKACEVPFRPNGKKPVFCSDCFIKDEDHAPRGDYAPRDSFRERSFQKPSAPYQREDRGLDDVKKQLEMLNRKVDSLVTLLEGSTQTMLAGTLAEKLAGAKKVVKKPAKRVSIKKK